MLDAYKAEQKLHRIYFVYESSIPICSIPDSRTMRSATSPTFALEHANLNSSALRFGNESYHTVFLVYHLPHYLEAFPTLGAYDAEQKLRRIYFVYRSSIPIRSIPDSRSMRSATSPTLSEIYDCNSVAKKIFNQDDHGEQ
ncbi:hypothetical protein CDAR_112811 [Caerostris darwini]|uniref:Uncharacterized protein n=1 Tax=Caerostris darwini TaxID=1538125 RepID=A0AAV4PY12_9ARAC|nr:hypothetical protein CDAR_112811 [Caerostris darwini]